VRRHRHGHGAPGRRAAARAQNYEIDLFQALIKAAARETGATDLENKSLRVIADHIRASAFMIVDGIIPSSEGRGYVLRRIIRRALRHGHKLGQTKPFFYKLVADLAIEMGTAYPELEDAKDRVAQMLKAEEERFGETLETGMKVLEAQLAKDARHRRRHRLHAVRHLRLPADLTADICRERNMTFDQAGYDAALKESQEAVAQGRQVDQGQQGRIRGREEQIRRLRQSEHQQPGARAVRRRHLGAGTESRPGWHRGARHHAVLRRIGRPGRATTASSRRRRRASSP
jgi:alanyl-tRNA synthetase